MAAETTTSAPPPGPAQGEGQRGRWGRLLWWAVFLVLLAGILGLGLYLWLREPAVVTRDLPGPGPSAQERALLEERARENEALAAELSRLRGDLEGLACPAGTIPDPTVPPALAPRAALSETPATGVASELAARMAPSGEIQTALQTSDLLMRLRGATALILTREGAGSGFFIAPELLVTNRHVVENSGDGQVLVTSKAL
ncbi:MAG: hypothetical protein VKI81_10920, partial [Synechococcaceae cyanobacterium]|nr:hypothetical protein [Synechococcaceae cyanobacterium]